MVNLDVFGIILAVLFPCICGVPTDILWSKEDGSNTGTVGNLLNTPGDLDSSDSLYQRLGDDSDYNDKQLSDFDYNFLDSRKRSFDPSAFAALRGKRGYGGELMENSASIIHKLQRRRFPSGFVAIRGKRTIPALPGSGLEYKLLLRSILQSIESLTNQRQDKDRVQKRQPPFGFHALRGR